MRPTYSALLRARTLEIIVPVEHCETSNKSLYTTIQIITANKYIDWSFIKSFISVAILQLFTARNIIDVDLNLLKLVQKILEWGECVSNIELGLMAHSIL